MKLLLLTLSCCLTLSCKQKTPPLPYYDTPDFTPRWQVANPDTFHRIRPFRLINQESELFTEKNMNGKICIVDFFFTTCPGICPKMTNSMAVIQQEFLNDDNVLLLSHTVTPLTDSVARLKKYALEKKVNSKRWKLLTGDKHEIYDLGRNYYFVEEDEGVKKNDDTFLHTENFILTDMHRHIRGIYNGLDPNSIRQLVADIKSLETE